MTTPEDTADLDWSAFCYLAGELTAAEAEAFETRLAGEQPAREALSRAVGLAQTIAAVESEVGEVVLPARQLSADWNTRLAWMAIGGLASLLLGLVWAGVIGPSQPVAKRGDVTAQYALAAAWTQTQAELVSVKEAGLWPSALSYNSDSADDLADTQDSLVEEFAWNDTPSWMDAAVLGMMSATQRELGPAERLEN